MTQADKIREEWNITKKAKVCFNCQYLMNVIGAGGGLRCKLHGGTIPGIAKSCDQFLLNNNGIQNES